MQHNICDHDFTSFASADLKSLTPESGAAVGYNKLISSSVVILTAIGAS